MRHFHHGQVSRVCCFFSWNKYFFSTSLRWNFFSLFPVVVVVYVVVGVALIPLSSLNHGPVSKTFHFFRQSFETLVAPLFSGVAAVSRTGVGWRRWRRWRGANFCVANDHLFHHRVLPEKKKGVKTRFLWIQRNIWKAKAFIPFTT